MVRDCNRECGRGPGVVLWVKKSVPQTCRQTNLISCLTKSLSLNSRVKLIHPSFGD